MPWNIFSAWIIRRKWKYFSFPGFHFRFPVFGKVWQLHCWYFHQLHRSTRFVFRDRSPEEMVKISFSILIKETVYCLTPLREAELVVLAFPNRRNEIRKENAERKGVCTPLFDILRDFPPGSHFTAACGNHHHHDIPSERCPHPQTSLQLLHLAIYLSQTPRVCLVAYNKIVTMYNLIQTPSAFWESLPTHMPPKNRLSHRVLVSGPAGWCMEMWKCRRRGRLKLLHESSAHLQLLSRARALGKTDFHFCESRKPRDVHGRRR